MVDIDRETESDSEDEEYRFEDENLEDNVDNASSDNEIIVHHRRSSQSPQEHPM